MKRILVLFGILAYTQIGAFAYMYESEASSIKTLEMQGYSEGTMEIFDDIKFRNSRINGKYVRHYQKKEHNNKLGKAYHTLKVYFDPLQDDGNYANHEIPFSNTWNNDRPGYASEFVRNNQVEDL